PVNHADDLPDLETLSAIPATAAVAAEAKAGRGRRSLRMQIRYLRSLIFAAKLFVRLLFWYYFMPRVIGQKAVDRGSTERWIIYPGELRGFAILMGGVMIKLG